MAKGELKGCTEPEKNLYRKAINRYGDNRQIAKAIEVLGKLSTELSRNLVGDNNKYKIICGIADVQNLLIQMKILFDQEYRVEGIMFQKMKDEFKECLKNCDNCGNEKCTG